MPFMRWRRISVPPCGEYQRLVVGSNANRDPLARPSPSNTRAIGSNIDLTNGADSSFPPKLGQRLLDRPESKHGQFPRWTKRATGGLEVRMGDDGGDSMAPMRLGGQVEIQGMNRLLERPLEGVRGQLFVATNGVLHPRAVTSFHCGVVRRPANPGQARLNMQADQPEGERRGDVMLGSGGRIPCDNRFAPVAAGCATSQTPVGEAGASVPG